MIFMRVFNILFYWITLVSGFRGALTNRQYNTAFRGRPWEYRTFNTIDVLDSLNCSLELSLKGGDIVRILPSTPSNSLGGEWVSDRVRYSVGSLRSQRLDIPLAIFTATKSLSSFTTLSWKQVFYSLKQLSSRNNAFVYSKHSSQLIQKPNSTLYFLLVDKGCVSFDLATWFWVDRLYDIFTVNSNLSFSNITNVSYLFIPASILVKKNALFSESFSTIFLFGPELAHSLPVLWSYLDGFARRSFANNLFSFGSTSPIKFTSIQKNFKQVGNLRDLKRLISGNHWLSTLVRFSVSKKTMFLFTLEDGETQKLFEYALRVSKVGLLGSLKVLPIHETNSAIHSTLFGLSSIHVSSFIETSKRLLSETSVLALGGIDLGNIDASSSLVDETIKKSLSIYLSSHPTSIMQQCRLVLPTSSHIEDRRFYINLFGQAQQTAAALPSPGLSSSTALVFLLFYSCVVRLLSRKNLISFVNSLCNYVVSAVLLNFVHKNCWSFINRFVELGVSKLLNLPVFLKEFVDLEFSLLQLSQNNRSVEFYQQLNKWDPLGRVSVTNASTSKNSGFLGFGDALASNSTELLWAKLLLTKQHGIFSNVVSNNDNDI
jgi:hypothetical protein